MDQIKKLIPRSIGGHLHAVHFTNEKVNKSEDSKHILFVIFCHGFKGDKYEWGRFTETAIALSKVDFESLLFDFSGYGENEQEFITLSKQARDLEDVYDWVKNQGYSNIAVIGLSFGGLTLLVANLPEIKEALESREWVKSLPFTKKPQITFLHPKMVTSIVDQTKLIKDQSDIVPMALARLALNFMTEEQLLPKVLKKVVRLMQM